MTDCVFCKMMLGKIPVTKLAEDPRGLAFIIRDLNPQANEHLLVIPTVHTLDLSQAARLYMPIVEACMWLAADYGAKHLPEGYRVLTNTGNYAGQVVKHLHFHILGGQQLKAI